MIGADVGGARGAYREGVDTFYKEQGSDYHNPHEDRIHAILRPALEDLQPSRVLDLAAGSGEVSRCVLQWNEDVQLDALDPYTHQAYENAIRRPCRRLSFRQIAETGLNRSYDVIVCSFALHLANPSLLYGVCIQLALHSRFLVIITQHKRPHIDEGMGWTLKQETLQDRVRLRLYSSRFC